MLQLPNDANHDLIENYEEHYLALAELAEELHVPPDEADELIQDVMTTALHSRYVTDVRAWLAAALTSAVNHRGGRAS